MSTLAEQVAAALGCTSRCYPAHGGKHSPTCIQRRERDTHVVLRVVAEWLGSEDVVELTARTMALIEPGDDWPTNLALGGNLTGTRDDEYRHGMREQATETLDALRREVRT